MATFNHCASCTSSIRKKSFAKCTSCENTYHFNHCSVKTANSWKKLKKTWTCENCESLQINQGANISVDDPISSLRDELKLAKEQIEKLQTTLELLEKKCKCNSVTISALSQNSLETSSNIQPTIQCNNKFTVLSDKSEEKLLKNYSKQSPERKSIATRKKKIVLVADSNGRECGLLLKEEAGPDYEAVVISYPGASFEYISKAASTLGKSLNKDDHLFIMGGSKDVPLVKAAPAALDFKEISSITTKTNVSLIHVPYRYDKPFVNINVQKTNEIISNNAKILNYSCINLSHLERQHSTNHGFNLSKLGKRMLCQLVISRIHKSIDPTSTSKTPIFLDH